MLEASFVFLGILMTWNFSAQEGPIDAPIGVDKVRQDPYPLPARYALDDCGRRIRVSWLERMPTNSSGIKMFFSTNAAASSGALVT